ncbi:DAK2 domain-containing protein [Mycoplasmopsis felis]|uniref:DAK2 domain-containing protein n=1 Tax=Mycoplasmopsis felis TaxID=33923 RepID=UPI002AFFCFFF|nr:DAK2 domain-containing protein [Mycoplasmopsis felis]WQQ07663.1 DAK2 domain-containing protein [Mycoplasmopsis felis]
MSKVFLNTNDFYLGILSGSNSLVNAKNKIDALNVFPVPDGDTGTNMSSTISQAISKLEQKKDLSIGEFTKELALNMMYEARGNSGVILSQIFKGFSLGCSNKEYLTLPELLEAFNLATERAYKSVFTPVEGTILTVIRETSGKLSNEFKDKTDVSLIDFWKKVVEFSRKSCDETPNKLKTLREVGVTDSGGEGLYTIFVGFYEYLKGNFVQKKDKSDEVSVFLSDTEVYSGEFGYCTEVLIDLTEPDKFDKQMFSNELEKISNSLVIVSDDNLLKVHGHTITPGDFLNVSQKYGEFIKIKSENMTLQANNSKAKVIVNEEDLNECGIISCNLGSGIIQRMKDLGCDYVVESGQTQNPSAQDLINAINKVKAKTVFILPNNSNIILVAQQAAQVITDKNIVVIPTKTQIQGLAAVFNFNSELSQEENNELMLDAITEIKTGEITQAVRDTKLNNIKIKNNDYLGIVDGKIITSNSEIEETYKTLIDKMVEKSSQVITIFYGDNANSFDVESLTNYIESHYEVEIEVIEGNQPNYQFLIGVE